VRLPEHDARLRPGVKPPILFLQPLRLFLICHTLLFPLFVEVLYWIFHIKTTGGVSLELIVYKPIVSYIDITRREVGIWTFGWKYFLIEAPN